MGRLAFAFSFVVWQGDWCLDACTSGFTQRPTNRPTEPDFYLREKIFATWLSSFLPTEEEPERGGDGERESEKERGMSAWLELGRRAFPWVGKDRDPHSNLMYSSVCFQSVFPNRRQQQQHATAGSRLFSKRWPRHRHRWKPNYSGINTASIATWYLFVYDFIPVLRKSQVYFLIQICFRLYYKVTERVLKGLKWMLCIIHRFVLR